MSPVVTEAGGARGCGNSRFPCTACAYLTHSTENLYLARKHQAAPSSWERAATNRGCASPFHTRSAQHNTTHTCSPSHHDITHPNGIPPQITRQIHANHNHKTKRAECGGCHWASRIHGVSCDGHNPQPPRHSLESPTQPTPCNLQPGGATWPPATTRICTQQLIESARIRAYRHQQTTPTSTLPKHPHHT